jgi:apolipoprotein N-acyltransferase
LRKDRRQKTEDRRQKANGLSSVVCPLSFIASAAMLTVIQPPIGWSLLVWISLVPFILACSPQAKPKRLALAAYIISLCYWLGNLYWVFPITILGWATFCLYTALLWPILALCLRFCRTKKIPLFIATPVLVVGAERLQGFLLGGFFWRFLAHSQYANITLIQIADIFGTAGVSFLIAMVNGLLAELILDARYSILDARHCKTIFKIGNLSKIVVVCAAVITAFGYGHWRINQSPDFITQGPLVASLQSNVPQSVKKSFAESDRLFDDLMDKSKESARAGAKLIVWPETMVQATLNPEILALLDPSHSYLAFDQALKKHAKDTAYVLVGAYGGGKPEFQDDSTIRLGERYNSAFLYRPDGTQAPQHYDKIHLVPFGEVLPLRKTVPWFYDFLMKLEFIPYHYDYSLDYGSEYTAFEISNSKFEIPNLSRAKPRDSKFRFGVIICYEDTIPAIARRFALDEHGQKRVDWLVNISNDGWFVRFKNAKVYPSAEQPQHAAVCVFRAVENRLAVLRSVNTGISCLIDSLGRIQDSYIAASGDFPAKAMERKGMAGWFVGKMPIDRRVAFFSRYGQWLDFSCTACFVLLIMLMLWARFMKPKIKTRVAG